MVVLDDFDRRSVNGLGKEDRDILRKSAAFVGLVQFSNFTSDGTTCLYIY